MPGLTCFRAQSSNKIKLLSKIKASKKLKSPKKIQRLRKVRTSMEPGDQDHEDLGISDQYGTVTEAIIAEHDGLAEEQDVRQHDEESIDAKQSTQGLHRVQHPSIIVSAVTTGVVVLAVFQKLKAMGLVDHLLSKMGGGIGDTEASTAVKRFAAFLHWMHENSGDVKNDLPDVLDEIIEQTITDDFADLASYVTHLEKIKEFSASTMINHINDIVKGAKWFVLFKSGRRLTQNDLQGLLYVSSNLKKNLNKDMRGTRGEVTMKQEVYLRHQPAGGLAELQEGFPRQLDKLKALLDAAPRIIGKSEYTWFCGMMYTSLYVFAPQGRIGGVKDIKVQQFKDFRLEGHAETTKFKTNKKWGYQFVIVGSVSFDLVKKYHDIFRPLAVSNFIASKEYPTLTDGMWLSWDGTPDNVGVRITQWIKGAFGLHMTSNNLRSLVETTTAQLEKAGKISKEARAAVSAINGHTSQVATNFYVHEDRIAEVSLARKALGPTVFNTDFNKLGPASPFSVVRQRKMGDETDSSDEEKEGGRPKGPDTPAQDSHDDASLQWPTQDNLLAADWGKDHPDYGKSLKKASWSCPEVGWVADFCENKVAGNPSAKKTIVAKCLKAIQKDPEAMRIFHANHVLNSSRLRTGYRLAMERGYFSEEYMAVNEC
jgi:hypothetical protein